MMEEVVTIKLQDKRHIPVELFMVRQRILQFLENFLAWHASSTISEATASRQECTC
jgi:hypothetical protein